ncbi:hypothetical protein ACFWBN_34265 [Streptomyces sp. NPDC059989]|uniref:hypothetical protein n=1 Tax=Streptomyces sp. NPDC059989 TaxID=3347026 RepID=UPI0036A47B7C
MNLLQSLLASNTLLAVPFFVGLLMLLRPGQWRAAGLLLPHERRAVWWRRGATLLGLVVAALLAYLPVLGLRGDWLAGPAFGAVVLAGVLAGELAVPRPASDVRSATLATRRIRDYLPRGHRVLLAVLLAALVALLTTMAVLAGSHPASRRGIHFACEGVTEIIPAAAVGMPAITATAFTLVGSAALCLPVLRKIVGRPPIAAGSDGATRDAALREGSAHAVFYAWGCLLASSLFTSALVVHVLFGGFASTCTSWWLTPLNVAAYLAMAMGGPAFVYLLTKLTHQPRYRQAAP